MSSPEKGIVEKKKRRGFVQRIWGWKSYQHTSCALQCMVVLLHLVITSVRYFSCLDQEVAAEILPVLRPSWIPEGTWAFLGRRSRIQVLLGEHQRCSHWQRHGHPGRQLQGGSHVLGGGSDPAECEKRLVPACLQCRLQCVCWWLLLRE